MALNLRNKVLNLIPAMNKLPDEILRYIFQFLDFKSLIRSKMVQKRWYFIIQNSMIYELSLCSYFDLLSQINNQLKNEPRFWFYTNSKINANCFHVCKTKEAISKWFSSSCEFPNLKRLKIIQFSVFEKVHKATKFELFNQLEHLEFELSYSDFPKGPVSIKLNNLKILSLQMKILYRVARESVLFQFDCPKLEGLCSNILSLIQLNNPDGLKYLETNIFKESLTKFKKLELLHLNSTMHLDQNILSFFPALKQLNLITSEIRTSEIVFLNSNYYESLKSKINYIVQQKSTLNRPVEIYFSGVLLENENQINESYFIKDRWNLLLNNRTIDKLPYFNSINYSSFIKQLDRTPIEEKFFEKFGSKFCNLQRVNVIDLIDNQDHFIWFIKNCHNLSELILKNANLNQLFFDYLPNCQLLNSLILNDSNNLKLDFNFLSKIKFLINFETDQELAIQIGLNLFKSLDYFHRLKIYNKDNFVVSGCRDQLDLFCRYRNGRKQYKYNSNIQTIVHYFELKDRRNELARTKRMNDKIRAQKKAAKLKRNKPDLMTNQIRTRASVKSKLRIKSKIDSKTLVKNRSKNQKTDQKSIQK